MLTICAEDTSRITKLCQRHTNPTHSRRTITDATTTKNQHHKRHHRPACRTLRQPWHPLRIQLREPRHPSSPLHFRRPSPYPKFSRYRWASTTQRTTKHPPKAHRHQSFCFHKQISPYLPPFQIARRGHDQGMRDTVQMLSVSYRNTRWE